MPQARYYQKKENQTIQCGLCPHNCIIHEGKSGICQVRANQHGEMQLPFYGRLSALALDPIEKKPLFHFHPGKKILSAGFLGCNFRCPFCQNYHISQGVGANTDFVSPEEIIKSALADNSFAIAYTYSEPIVHLEYVLAAAKLAHANGLKNVLVSNGFINNGPADELIGVLDAANIDLKAWNDDFYRKEIKGSLEPVKEFITMAAKKIHVEVTTLIIPNKNDSDDEMDRIAGFIAGINPDIPLHLSCYYPTYQYSIPATHPERVFELVRVAGRHLNYVYAGNIGSAPVNTACKACNNILISRRGYSTVFPGLKNGKCAKCGAEIDIPGLSP
ncbi:MAG: AmmeMemoRadiSam system radical SAM enzyme [Spirochaetaceae bacterium]|nr:MAG: AmmeMemoRadiSam system radical SAM enzyme [Spirochaetaceae bacterium]